MIGHTLAHYEILEKVGEGGMGVVYRARDTKLGREVALKFLPPEFSASADLKERFNKEAQAASALDHPNICTIYAMEETDDGRLFIAMAYYEGETLKTRLKRGPLKVSEVADLGLQIATGLASAHERGIVHMDIKPANLMITRDGTVKILDFGLSKFTTHVSEQSQKLPSIDARSSERSRTTLMGTVAYMSPERVQGRSAGPENDVWSLGVVLYEMATGNRPFIGASDMSVLYAIVNRDFVPPIKEMPKIPVELDKTIRRALVKDKRYRYRDMAELAADLENLQHLSQTVPGGPRPHWEYDKMRRRVSVLLSFLVLAALIGWLLFRKPEGPGVSAATEAPGALLLGFRNLSGPEDAAWMGLFLDELLRIEIPGHSEWQWKEASGADLPAGLPGLAAPALARWQREVGAEAVVGGVYKVEPESALEIKVTAQSTATGKLSGPFTARGPREDLWDFPRALIPDLAAALDLEPREWPAEAPALVPEAVRLVEEAREELRLLNAPRAHLALMRAVEIDPPNPEIHNLLAQSHEMIGRNEEARRHADLARDEARRWPRREQLFYIGRQLVASGKLNRGAALLYALWISDPASPRRLEHGLYLIPHLAEAGYKEAAGEVLGSLRELAPDDPRVELAAAASARSQSLYSRQVEAARRAAVQARALPNAPFLLAEAYTFEGDGQWWLLVHFDEALEALEKGRKIYAAQGYAHQGEARALYTSGNILFEKRKLLEAKTCYDEAARIYGAIGNRNMQARTLGNKGLVVRARGDLLAASEVFRQVIELLQESGDEKGEAMALLNLAETLVWIGDFDGAAKAYERALSLVDQVRNQSIESVALDSLGRYLVIRGELEKAGRHLDRALELQTQAEDQHGMAQTLAVQARVYFLQGDLEMAQKTQWSALAIFEASPDLPSDQARLLQELGETLMAMGDVAAARERLEKALEILEEPTVEPHLLAETYVSFAELLLEEGDASGAEKWTNEAMTFLAQKQAVLIAARIHGVLASSLLAQGRIDRAREEIARGEELLGTIDSPVYRIPLEITAARVLAAAGDEEAARDVLSRILVASTTGGFSGWELEARLALCEIELLAGRDKVSLKRLVEVEKEAGLKGFGAIAEKARRALEP